MIQKGFHQSTADSSLFTKHGVILIALTVYVDDTILASNNEKAIKDVKHYLHDCFSIKDLGKVKFILGMEIARNKEDIHLYKRKYTLELLAEYSFIDCKPVSTPIVIDKVDYRKTKLLDDNTSYRKLIGKLLYLTNTRPNTAFAIQQLSRFLDKPHEAHLIAANRILRYLKLKPTLGVFYSSTPETQVNGFTDFDWENCPDTRKSITGFCIFIGDFFLPLGNLRSRI